MISGKKPFKKLSTIMLAALFVGLYGFTFLVSGPVSFAADDSATTNSEKPAQAVEAKPEPKPEAKEVDNQTCLGCHNPDILKMSKEELADQVNVGDKPVPSSAKPLFVFGELNLSIDEKKYGEGIHKDLTCVSCHKDITEIPHNQRLALVDCKECHEDSFDSIQGGAHGKKAGPKAPPCIGCHNVHYGQAQSTYEGEFKSRVCLDCHTAYGMNNAEQHKFLQQAEIHMKLGCLVCHKGDKPGVHNMPAAKGKTASCEQCHNKYSILSTAKPAPKDFFTSIVEIQFINKDLFDSYSYVVGAHRSHALDFILIILVLGTLALPIFHGGLRILTRKKGGRHASEEKIYLHPLFERIWHWFQALCVIMLIITGIMIHWPEIFPGWFDWSVSVHNWFGWAAVISWGAWFLYAIFSGRISHYFPKKGEIPGGLIKQAKFYGYGIFKHEPHPYAPSEDNKFNPLQKIAYLKFQLILLPLLLLSGLVFMYPETFSGVVRVVGGLWVVATIHFVLGALFAAFVIAHLYLATTGETVSENFKAMVSGYGTKEDHGDHTKKV